MQQTEKYQLNLIETGDTFSPAALNENAQKTEAALTAEAADRAAGDDALDERVTVLEARKFVSGYFVGNGGVLTIELGFTPTVVITAFGLRVAECGLSSVTIVPGGFKVVNKDSTSSSINRDGVKYTYFAVY